MLAGNRRIGAGSRGDDAGADSGIGYCATDFIQGDSAWDAGSRIIIAGLYAHQLGPAAMEDVPDLWRSGHRVIQIVFVLPGTWAGIYCIYGILKESFRKTYGGHGDCLWAAVWHLSLYQLAC